MPAQRAYTEISRAAATLFDANVVERLQWSRSYTGPAISTASTEAGKANNTSRDAGVSSGGTVLLMP